MNKVVVFFSMIVFSLSVSAQVRLNEIFPANNGQNKQWIELFSSGASIGNYRLVIRYKLGDADSGFYVMSLSGSANASNYFVVENNGNINWLNTGSSFSFLYSPNGCTDDYPWKKTQLETKGMLNTGSSTPLFDHWDVAYSIANAFTRTASDFYAVTNNRIPNGSPTFDYNASGNPTKLYLKYSISNTLMAVAMDNPVFYLYTDKGGANGLPNGVLDATDPVVVNGVSKSMEPINTVYMNVSITEDMFYTDAFGNRRLRPFFLVLVSQNTCFKTQDILLSGQIFALPVTLGSFIVSPLDGSCRLQWSTLTESNNAGFEVQRSLGVSSDYISLGFVHTNAKQGNSQSLLQYAFEDRDLKPGALAYYRLKQIDMDGKYSFGPVRSVKWGIGRSINIYPNPSQGSLTISTGMQGRQQILLMGMAGNVLQRLEQSSGLIQLHGLAPGTYVLKIGNGVGEPVMGKVIVQ